MRKLFLGLNYFTYLEKIPGHLELLGMIWFIRAGSVKSSSTQNPCTSPGALDSHFIIFVGNNGRYQIRYLGCG